MKKFLVGLLAVVLCVGVGFADPPPNPPDFEFMNSDGARADADGTEFLAWGGTNTDFEDVTYSVNITENVDIWDDGNATGTILEVEIADLPDDAYVLIDVEYVLQKFVGGNWVDQEVINDGFPSVYLDRNASATCTSDDNINACGSSNGDPFCIDPGVVGCGEPCTGTGLVCESCIICPLGADWQIWRTMGSCGHIGGFNSNCSCSSWDVKCPGVANPITDIIDYIEEEGCSDIMTGAGNPKGNWMCLARVFMMLSWNELM